LSRRTLANRYCPDWALAWLPAEMLGSQHVPDKILPGLLDYDCIAVDECQDLTPIEAYVLVELAARINKGRRVPVPFLLAGDEAQTVRPTDFEWGWLNDLLHSEVGTPAEHKLSANLRSPRRIAEMVNRVRTCTRISRNRSAPAALVTRRSTMTQQTRFCIARRFRGQTLTSC